MRLYSGLLKIAAGSHPTEAHAAKELQKYLANITGVTIPVVLPSEAGESANTIFIGETAPMTEADKNSLKLDGFIIRTLPDNCLMLAGNKAVSSLYAVYALLEEYCGCGFFEDGEQIPFNPNLTIDEIDLLDNPKFEYRTFLVNGSRNYGGIMWNNAEETIAWLDILAKKRINVLFPNGLIENTSLIAETFREMGYDIQPTEFQKERTTVLSQAFAHAKKIGIMTQITLPVVVRVDENMTLCSETASKQICAFIEQYDADHEIPLSCYRYIWCDERLYRLHVTEPEVQRFYKTYISMCQKVLHVGHVYWVYMPSEGSFSAEYSLEEIGQHVIDNYRLQIQLIREVDPEAIIFSSTPYPYVKTYPYQKKAVEGQDVILRETYLDRAGHKYDYQIGNFYNGMRWMGGTLTHCACETNPCSDVRYTLSHIQSLARDSRAEQMVGFSVENEKHHRNVFANDLYFKIAWNPIQIDLQEFIKRYSERRYGISELECAVQDIADTLYSYKNLGLDNGVLYRRFHDVFLPGLMPSSVKVSISYLPILRRALESMLVYSEQLENNRLFRFDVTDYVRTYLSFLFNLYLGGARLGGYNGDLNYVQKYSAKVLACMDDIAKICSAHEEFRIQTYYDAASRYAPLYPVNPDANKKAIYLTFTSLTGTENLYLLDYMAEDFCELIQHYYKPQIEYYLEDLNTLVCNGGKLSGRLTNNNLQGEIPNRCSEIAPPKGKLYWSAFGVTCEPELIAREQELRIKLIRGPIIEDPDMKYDGPITPLFAEMLEKNPVTEEMETLVSMDPFDTLNCNSESTEPLLDLRVGEIQRGINIGIIVEQYDIDKEVISVFDCKVIGREYNLLRGDIERIRIRATDFVTFKRIDDVEDSEQKGTCRQYQFELMDNIYILSVYEGSDIKPSSVYVSKSVE